MVCKSVGIFDSGLGGLTAFAALRRKLPEENIIYFGDTGRCPYGGRSVEELREIAKSDLAFLESRGVKSILAACGTVSSNCRELLESSSVKVVNVRDASMKALSRESGTLGVIATEASIRSGAFSLPDREVKGIACPDFVRLIESGHTDREDSLLKAAVAAVLEPLRGSGAVLLGCTHYGIIESAIRDFLGEETKLLSASECAAEEMASWLQASGLAGGEGMTEFYTSGDPSVFDPLAERILNASGCHYTYAQRSRL